MKTIFIIGNLIAFFGLLISIYYLIVTHRVFRPANDDPISLRVFFIVRRRRFGAAVMTLTSIMFLVATNWFPNVQSVKMIVFWLILLILVFWLLVLALIDLIAVHKLRDAIIHQANQKIKKIVKKPEDSSAQDSDDHEPKNTN